MVLDNHATVQSGKFMIFFLTLCVSFLKDNQHVSWILKFKNLLVKMYSCLCTHLPSSIRLHPFALCFELVFSN